MTIINKRTKKIFLLVTYDSILTKIIFYLSIGEKNVFSIFLEKKICIFFEIYNKFVKFIKNMINISITLKILFHEN